MCRPISALDSKFSSALDQSQADLAQLGLVLLPVQSVRAKSCLCGDGEQLSLEFDKHRKFEFLSENQKSDIRFRTFSKETLVI